MTTTPAPPRAWPAPLSYGYPPTPSTAIPPPVTPYTLPADAVNILLLGSDRRKSSYRTDTILLLSLHPSDRAAVLISIPRDLYVYMPGLTTQRINAAVMYGNLYRYPGGGWKLLYDTLLYNLGIPIDHYAMIEMRGFSQLIETLDGVEVRVACPYTDWRLRSPDLDPEDEDNWRLFTVPAGVLHMDGDYALWYARARKKSSDFDRSRRQQEVLRAIYRRILNLNLIPKLPELYNDLTEMVTTDMSLLDLLSLAPMAARIDLKQLRSRFLGPGQTTGWITPSGAKVLLPKRSAIRDFFDEAFDFETPETIIPPPSITIEVANASSHPDWDLLAAERLVYAGYDTRLSSKFEPSDVPTHLIDYGKAPASVQQDILRTLGISANAVSNLPDPGSPFPFRLIVGDDYDPCFKPNLSHH